MHERPGPVRTDFHAELDDVDDRLVRAALRIVEAMPQLTDAFLAGDRDAIAEARTIGDDVAEACREVEDRGFVLIAREAPVASDLRRIVALLRLVTDVDRAASLMRHVPESLDLIDPRALPDEIVELIRRMATRAAEVYEAGVAAWRTGDPAASGTLEQQDQAVDDAQLRLLSLASETDDVEPAAGVALGLVARYYERIADHGVAFARDAAFVATGRRADS